MKSLAAVTVLALCTVGFAQKGPKADAVIPAMFKQAEKAFEAKNTDAISKGTTADFTETSMGKTAKKAESMKGLKQFLGMFKTVHCKYTMTSLKSKGNSATTTETIHLWGDSMPDPKTHKSGKIDASRNQTCNWVLQGGHWLVKSMVATNEKMTLNGKPMMGG